MSTRREERACPSCGASVRSRGARFCSRKCSSNDPEVKRRIRQKCDSTVRERYGVDNVFQLDAVKLRSNATRLKSLGVEHPMQSPEVRARARASMIERHGAPHALQSASGRARFRATSLQRYGTEHPSSAEANRRKISESKKKRGVGLDEAQLRALYTDQRLTYQEIGERFGVSPCYVQRRREDYGIDPVYDRSESALERELHEFLDGLGVDYYKHRRDVIPPRELDVYVPSRRLAIEMHGVYWHSHDPRDGRGKRVHLEKADSCRAAGIDLLQPLDVEWRDAVKGPILRDMIKARLGLVSRLGARDCEVVDVSDSDARAFLERNHLQGWISSETRLGLSHSSSGLVQLMTFGRARYSRDSKQELLRLATARGVVVVGGTSKLFETFKRRCSPESVVSYCDRRFFNGNAYERLGFVQVKTQLGYWYWHPRRGCLEHRSRYQKHKLERALATYDPALTEAENMAANGYRRFYDAGQATYSWTRTS